MWKITMKVRYQGNNTKETFANNEHRNSEAEENSIDKDIIPAAKK